MIDRLFPLAPIKHSFWIIAALNFADYLLTSAIITAGGQEANPYVQYYIDMFGSVGILIAKSIPLLILGYIVFLRWHLVRPEIQFTVELSLLASKYAYGAVILYSISVLLALNF